MICLSSTCSLMKWCWREIHFVLALKTRFLAKAMTLWLPQYNGVGSCWDRPESSIILLIHKDSLDALVKPLYLGSIDQI